MSLAALQTPVEPAAAPRRWTYDALLAEMEETNQPHELWDGELAMSPSPSCFHQEISDRLHDAVKAWVREHRAGKTFAAPMDMILTQHHATQPDVMFISNERRAIIQDRVRGAADWVAEIISPGSRRRDRIDKRDLYEQHGVREYWILDPEAQTVEALFLEAGQYRLLGRWRPDEMAASRLLPGFQVSVRWLFLGEPD